MGELIGQSIGRYHILEQLGEGGMATVYKAYDTRLERDVAIKIIRMDQFPPAMLEIILKRFEREAKSLAKLSHANIVHIEDYGEHEGVPYLVMDYLPGGTLKEKLGRQIPWAEAARLLLPVASALAYAHRQGVIHRDVKPNNIIMAHSGDPMLTDFGIAKLLDTSDTQTLTGSGVGIGTPEYMAPEQALGNEIDARVDVYALGVVFYEMVTGKKPFTANTPMAVVFKHISDPLPRPSGYVPDLPEAVEYVLIKSLAKKPEDRYADMSAFAAALEGLAVGQGYSTSAASQGRDVSARADDTHPERAAREQAEREAAEKTAREQAEREAAEKSAREQAEREAAEKAAHEQAEREAAEKSAREQAEREAAKQAALEQAERAAAEKAARDATEKQEREFKENAVVEKARLTEEQRRRELTPDLGEGVTLEFVRVPAGEFWMGSGKKVDSQAMDCEFPQHKVTLNEYLIGKYPVTNRQYQVFVQKTGYHAPPHWKAGSIPAGKENHPVVYVSWQDSVDFCQWASKIAGQTVRLPSEAEWEKAARGTDGRIYPWGNQKPDASLCNYAETKIGETTVVGRYGSKDVSPYGCADMAGNVWEWTADWYAAYPGNTTNNSNFGTKYRVLRGGSWDVVENFLRVSYRVGYRAVYRDLSSGFRCVA